MKKAIKMGKRIYIALFVIMLAVVAMLGCDKADMTLVSEQSRSGAAFFVTFEEFMQEDFNLLFADAQDGSYMLSMEVMERPGIWSWKEALIQCGNTNIEDFIVAGSSFYEWKVIEVGNLTLEYIVAEEGETKYAVGVLAKKDQNYGVTIYGNFGEALLQNVAQEIKVEEEGFGFELSGLIQNLSFSNRGKSLEAFKVQYFENTNQTKQYLEDLGIGVSLKELKSGKDISLGTLTGKAVGYGLDGAGKTFFAGQSQGSVGSLGLIELPEKKGFLLLEYTNRSREGNVQNLPKHFEKVASFF